MIYHYSGTIGTQGDYEHELKVDGIVSMEPLQNHSDYQEMKGLITKALDDTKAGSYVIQWLHIESLTPL